MYVSVSQAREFAAALGDRPRPFFDVDGEVYDRPRVGKSKASGCEQRAREISLNISSVGGLYWRPLVLADLQALATVQVLYYRKSS